MRMLFIALIWMLVGSDILGKDMSLGPGLSVKNAMLYLIALTLYFRLALSSGGARLRLPMFHGAFALWLGYATLSYITCCLIIHYDSYSAIQSGMSLKVSLYDATVFCFAFFYGVQDEVDFKSLTRALAAAIGVSSILTLTDVVGLTSLGVRIGTSGAEADRVFGMFGHANDTGALMVCLLPVMVAVAASSRGLSRAWWYACVLSTAGVLILTVSRGAYAAVLLGYGAACILCRRFLPLSRVGPWLLTGVTMALALCALVGVAAPTTGAVILDRLTGHTSVYEMSSGRTDIWWTSISHMLEEPVTFLTGFGWNVFGTRFDYVSHNYYLDQLFDLGIIGLIAFLAIFYQAIASARAAAERASPEMRPYIIALIFGILGYLVAITFSNPGKEWLYVWIYMGITLSAAGAILSSPARRAVAEHEPAAPGLLIARGHRAPRARSADFPASGAL